MYYWPLFCPKAMGFKVCFLVNSSKLRFCKHDYKIPTERIPPSSLKHWHGQQPTAQHPDTTNTVIYDWQDASLLLQ